MPQRFDPRLDVLPAAQRAIWASLSPAPRLSFVLYGGTAIALILGHRQSVDFDFFRTAPLDKDEIRRTFPFFDKGTVTQDSPDTLVLVAHMPSLRAIGFFKDGDLPTLSSADQNLLRNARDQVRDVPEVQITRGSLAIALGP